MAAYEYNYENIYKLTITLKLKRDIFEAQICFSK